MGLAATPQDYFGRANQAYEAGDYAGSVVLYDSVLSLGDDAAAYYNRGNAWFKQGMVGKAIADFCRAYALKPSDRDIRYNLAFARSFRPDKTLTLENPFVRLFTGLLRALDLASARALAGIAFLLAMAALCLQLVRRPRLWTPFGSIAAGWLAAALGIIFLYAAASWASWTGEVNASHAVVVVPELTLRSGPGAEYKEIAVIHDGLEGAVHERRPGYVLIQVPGGIGGWAESASVELIFGRSR